MYAVPLSKILSFPGLDLPDFTDKAKDLDLPSLKSLVLLATNKDTPSNQVITHEGVNVIVGRGGWSYKFL